MWTIFCCYCCCISCQEIIIIIVSVQILNWLADLIPSACESRTGKQEVSCGKASLF